MCVLGNRLLKDIDPENCTKDVGSELFQLYCNDSSNPLSCDPYFKMHNLTVRNGIKGLSSGVFFGMFLQFLNVNVLFLFYNSNIFKLFYFLTYLI